MFDPSHKQITQVVRRLQLTDAYPEVGHDLFKLLQLFFADLATILQMEFERACFVLAQGMKRIESGCFPNLFCKCFVPQDSLPF